MSYRSAMLVTSFSSRSVPSLFSMAAPPITNFKLPGESYSLYVPKLVQKAASRCAVLLNWVCQYPLDTIKTEIGEQATSKETIIELKTKLEKSAAFKDDPDFVINLLNLSVEDRQAKAERQLQETNSQLECEFSNYQFKVRFGRKKNSFSNRVDELFWRKEKCECFRIYDLIEGWGKEKNTSGSVQDRGSNIVTLEGFEFLKSGSEEAGSTNASCTPVCLQNETGGENDVDLTGGVTNSGKTTDGSNLFLLKVSETFDECLYDVSHISNSGIRDKVRR
ncbi:hypothetical protein TNCV_4896611 [Trichonephila clavipes]|uniref:Uncharacterized protein n=1 Tax=Trichonephila clavipes TaxID=2585209 RepID=A0A8X6VX23_TRICX|nr:hypothetical protein TNCV_4896611 [Trichonephila clavipes]